MKLIHDHYKDQIKLIVSGSSIFSIKSKFKDSLVGRVVDFEIFPLDFIEFLRFKEVNINFFSNIPQKLNDELVIMFKEYIKYDSYPRIVLEKNIEKKEKLLKQIINTYVKKDLSDIAKIRDLNKFNVLLRILSEQSGSLLNINKLSTTLGIARQTIDHYLFIMENTYIIKLIQPYFKSIRSEISKMPKIFWEDSGLCQLLHYNHFIENIDGHLFENAIYTLLRKNNNISNLWYWRTKDKQEIDFIIEVKDQLIPVEVKLSDTGKLNHAFIMFMKKYNIKKGYIVTLNKSNKPRENCKSIYPWELLVIINNIFNN